MGRVATSISTHPPGSERAPTWQVWLALGTVYVVWGSTYLAIKIAIETLPSLLHAGVRFLFAGLLMAGVLAARRPAALRVTRPQLVTAAAVGVLLLGGNGLVVIAEEGVASSLAALLVAAVPLWIVVLRATFGDRPPAVTLAGVGVGFIGVAVLLLPGAGGHSDLPHAALVVVASLAWAGGSYLATRRPMPANAFAATTYEMLAGGAVLLVAGLVLGAEIREGVVGIVLLFGLLVLWAAAYGGLYFALSHTSVRSAAAFGYLVVFGSLGAFTAYAWLLGHAPVSQVATYAYVNPAVAVLLGALILGEPVTAGVLAGGAVILASVAVVVGVEAQRSRH